MLDVANFSRINKPRNTVDAWMLAFKVYSPRTQESVSRDSVYARFLERVEQMAAPDLQHSLACLAETAQGILEATPGSREAFFQLTGPVRPLNNRPLSPRKLAIENSQRNWQWSLACQIFVHSEQDEQLSKPYIILNIGPIWAGKWSSLQTASSWKQWHIKVTFTGHLTQAVLDSRTSNYSDNTTKKAKRCPSPFQPTVDQYVQRVERATTGQTFSCPQDVLDVVERDLLASLPFSALGKLLAFNYLEVSVRDNAGTRWVRNTLLGANNQQALDKLQHSEVPGGSLGSETALQSRHIML